MALPSDAFLGQVPSGQIIHSRGRLFLIKAGLEQALAEIERRVPLEIRSHALPITLKREGAPLDRLAPVSPTPRLLPAEGVEKVPREVVVLDPIYFRFGAAYTIEALHIPPKEWRLLLLPLNHNVYIVAGDSNFLMEKLAILRLLHERRNQVDLLFRGNLPDRTSVRVVATAVESTTLRLVARISRLVRGRKPGLWRLSKYGKENALEVGDGYLNVVGKTGCDSLCDSSFGLIRPEKTIGHAALHVSFCEHSYPLQLSDQAVQQIIYTLPGMSVVTRGHESTAKYESLERLAIHVPPKDTKYCVADSLEGIIFEASDVSLYPESAYQRHGFPFKRYSNEYTRHWCRAHRTDGVDSIWIPAEIVCWPIDEDVRFVQATSNGSAIGVSRESAMLGGFLELLERHAVLSVWYLRLIPPWIAWQDVDDEIVHRISMTLYAAGFDILILDLSGRFQAFVIGCIIFRRDAGWPSMFFGSGASLEAVSAIRKALMESYQAYEVQTSGANDRKHVRDGRGERYQDPIYRECWKFLSDGMQLRFADLVQRSTDGFYSSEEWQKSYCVDRWTPAESSPLLAVTMLSFMLQPLHFGNDLERFCKNRFNLQDWPENSYIRTLPTGYLNSDHHPLT